MLLMEKRLNIGLIFTNKMEGLIIFYKPINYSSNDIVNYFKKITNKKVGHGGALDPLASGLLIIGIGEYTKELQGFLKAVRKTYIAEIKLGFVSDTYDNEGKIRPTDKFIPPKEEIVNILESFKNKTIKQKPPIFSAVKVKGVPAYKLARKNINPSLSEKEVIIYDLELLEYFKEEKIIKIELEVSSGFYVRSFANDLGEILGCGAYLENLIRTKINGFKLEEALTFEDIKRDYLESYLKVYGRVQGVGFRFFTEKIASRFDILGYVKNLDDGSVEIVAQGSEVNLQKFIKEIKIGPILSKVEKLDIIFKKPKFFYQNFERL